MALTNRHWLALTVLSCLAVAVALLPPQPPDQLYAMRTISQRPWVDRAEYDLQRAVDGLVQARRVDSLLTEADRRGALPGDPPLVLVDSRLPTAVDELARRLVGGFATTVDEWSDEVRIVVGVVLDSGGSVDGLPRYTYGSPQRYWRPTQTDGVTCVVTIPIDRYGMNVIQRGNVTPRSLGWRTSGGLLGPCAFYASYGLPGTPVAGWLALHQGYIAEGVYPASAAGVREVRPTGRSAGVSARSRTLSFNTMMAAFDRGYWYWWRGGQVSAEACVAGVARECRSLLVDDPYEGIARSWWSWRWWRSRHPLGRNADYLLADIELELGRERFARFWSSDEPVDSTFYREAGIPIEQWAMDWLQGQVERVPPPGPRLQPWSMILSLLMAGLAVGGGCWVAVRRTMG